jgi:hypothetical protein
MIRPGDYEDRALFVDHDGVWRQKRGATDGVIERVPEPWLERFLLRWFPHLALRRRQAQAALARLEAQGGQHPNRVTVRRWDHEAQRWTPPQPPPPAGGPSFPWRRDPARTSTRRLLGEPGRTRPHDQRTPVRMTGRVA